MAKKKVEHVVFDGMRKVRKEINIKKFNKNTPRFPKAGNKNSNDASLNGKDQEEA